MITKGLFWTWKFGDSAVGVEDLKEGVVEVVLEFFISQYPVESFVLSNSTTEDELRRRDTPVIRLVWPRYPILQKSFTHSIIGKHVANFPAEICKSTAAKISILRFDASRREDRYHDVLNGEGPTVIGAIKTDIRFLVTQHAKP